MSYEIKNPLLALDGRINQTLKELSVQNILKSVRIMKIHTDILFNFIMDIKDMM